MKILKYIIPFVSILFVSCINELSEEGIYEDITIRGNVVEQNSQQPIEGVNVRMVKESSGSSQVQVISTTTTSSDGTFELPVEYENLIFGCSVEVFADSLYDGTTVKLENRGFGQQYYNVGTLYVAGPELPTVTTSNEVTNVTATSARCGGNVTTSGKSAVFRRGLCWSKLQYPTLTNAYSTNGRDEGEFIAALENLEVGTTYYVRAYATNSVGTAYGEQRTFTTLSGLPVIGTQAVVPSCITATGAISGGEVTADGGFPVIQRGVCWSKSSEPTVNNAHTIDGNGIGSFVSALSNLTPNSTYYLRAYATNQNGTVYSQQRTFTTLSGLPVLGTQADSPVSITATSAIINSEVLSDGGFQVVTRGVCYSTTPNPSVAGLHTSDGSGTGAFTSYLVNLSPNTTYYYRAYATNANGIVYGEKISFTTGY